AYMVKHTTGGRESLGAVRRCDVEFDGRPGKVAERCAEFVPGERIAWVMIDDSFGFGKMFADMGFSFTLETLDERRTLIRNESFYRPRNLMARLMSALMMRRKFRALRRRVLANVKALAERRDAKTPARQDLRDPAR
ncbi:MAG TPA: SRPBCC family protein, partial [Polyangiaceae bacterium]